MRGPAATQATWSIAFSQEHFKTISYAKFGGQTECIMGNSKIVNDCTFEKRSDNDLCLVDVGWGVGGGGAEREGRSSFILLAIVQ